MGRKGAKSTLMAAIALYHLLEEGEPGPQVICGATTGDQARIVFTIAAKMVRAAPWLRARGVADLCEQHHDRRRQHETDQRAAPRRRTG